MSDEAKKFLAQWESQHIAALPRSQREEQARRLASQCRQDAANAGVSEEDLAAAVEGDLVGNMLDALNAAEFWQIYRDQSGEHERNGRWGNTDRDLF